MVEFLKTIKGEKFSYEKGKRYFSNDDSGLKDKVLVLEPTSKKHNSWTAIDKNQEGILFRTIDNAEMTLLEMIEENKILAR